MKNLPSLACAITLLAAAILGCASANTKNSEINRSAPKSFVSTQTAAPSAEKSQVSKRAPIASADSSSSKAKAGAARLKSSESQRTLLPELTTAGGGQNVKSNQSGKAYSPSGDNSVAKKSAPAKIISPAIENSGATAKCRDGSLSFSAHRRGTCSHHGGVAIWY